MMTTLIKDIIYVAIVIISASIIYLIFSKLLKKQFKQNNKQKTLINLILNIIKYFLLICVTLLVLNKVGIDTKALLASLGIVGLIAGLAIQDLLKDFIAGISILLENQFYVGDIVEISGFKGEVIYLGLKTTKIKGINKEVKIISNRNILAVTNYSIEKNIASLELKVDKKEDVKALELPKKIISMRLTKIDGDNLTYIFSFKADYLNKEDECLNMLEDFKILLDKQKIKYTYLGVL
jgi:small conductance mechanosensitive channel